jgi:hypothetical protein
MKYFFIIIFIFTLTFTTNSYAKSEYAYVVPESGLHIRKEPSKNSSSLGLIPFGNILEVVSKAIKDDIIDGNKGCWFKVKWNSIEGYSFNYYFRFTPKIELSKKSPKLMNTIYSEGIDCSGNGGGEYTGTLEFSSDKVFFKRKGAINDGCALKNPQEPIGYTSIYLETKIGTYEIQKDVIILKFNKLEIIISPTAFCIDTKKKYENKVINEKYKLIPINCMENSNIIEGFIAPGFGDWTGIIWVPSIK